jgi:FAD-dependent urate hydroxylase
MPGTEERVLVVGGGIAGLTAALALRQQSIPVTVFEKETELREMACAIQIWVNGTVGLRELGLGDRLAAISQPVEHYRFYTWRGKQILEVPVGALSEEQGLTPPLMARRPDLVGLLVDAAGEDMIRWGARCVGYEQGETGVVVRLEDGSEERGALLVAGDGVDSTVAKVVDPNASPKGAGYQYLRALTRFEGAPRHEFSLTMGRGDRFLFHDLGDGWVYWAGVLVAEPGSGDPPQGRKAQLLERFADFPERIPAMIEATEERAIYRQDVRDLDPRDTWVDGRVVLIGDAAHATTPNLGRGAGEAIADGLALARGLGAAGGLGGDVLGALRAFDAERRAETTAVQKRSRRIGRIASWANPLACAARERILRHVAGRGMKRAMQAELSQLATETSSPPAVPASLNH